jgi:acyl carrier protein
MSMEEILNQVQEIFIDVLDEEEIEIFPETTANDVEEWDSLNHIQLVVAIEKHFNIKFSASEIQSYSNVGEMCDGIKEKL